MKRLFPHIILFAFIATAAFAAGPENFAGEWTDKNFNKGEWVVSLSVEQSGTTISVVYSGGHNDGHGAAPELDGKGKIAGKGRATFTWKDSFDNSGTATIKQAGKDVILSFKPTHIVEARCLVFYGQNMRLTPAVSGKK
jgi:hypothetical protein